MSIFDLIHLINYVYINCIHVPVCNIICFFCTHFNLNMLKKNTSLIAYKFKYNQYMYVLPQNTTNFTQIRDYVL